MLRALTMLRAVMLKEIRQTLRDRRVMALLIMAPVMQLIVFGFAVDLDVDRVPTVIVDRDRTSVSREHLERLLADGTLRETARLDTAEEAANELVQGRASVAIIVPEGYSRALARGRRAEPATVQVLVDGSDPNRSGVAAGAVGRYFGEAALEILDARRASMGTAAAALPRVSAIELRPRVLYNPRLETAMYMVPGVATMLLLLITTIVTAMGLAREREQGTLEQILVTPVRPGLLILGKMLPFAAIGLFDFMLAMTVGAYVFDMPIRGSFPLLLGATLLYLTGTLGAGLLISTLSNTQQQAFMGGFLFMLPAALLSGIMTPVRSMPVWLQPFTMVNPLRHYSELLRNVLLRGAGVEHVAPQLIALAIFGVAFATIASFRFRKTMS